MGFVVGLIVYIGIGLILELSLSNNPQIWPVIIWPVMLVAVLVILATGRYEDFVDEDDEEE